MQKTRRQLLNLALGELAAAASFMAAYRICLNFGAGSLLSLSFLVFILAQGSMYWGLRYRSTGKKKPFTAQKMVAVLRSADLIIAAPVAVLLVLLAESKRDLMLGILIGLFSAIEYINSYWYRLSYGSSGFNVKMLVHAGLRPSSIHKLLKRDLPGASG